MSRIDVLHGCYPERINWVQRRFPYTRDGPSTHPRFGACHTNMTAATVSGTGTVPLARPPKQPSESGALLSVNIDATYWLVSGVSDDAYNRAERQWATPSMLPAAGPIDPGVVVQGDTIHHRSYGLSPSGLFRPITRRSCRHPQGVRGRPTTVFVPSHPFSFTHTDSLGHRSARKYQTCRHRR